ncbi:hypothetical protein WA026_002194 [Henosepilachna vigintioctopunctata]|uniref:Uncharacterized protein n=1 Tax=Henosepilachna vigintioctopunctata TaxID=420089 RepID=A0AAW1TQN3_9CUCU
MSYYHYSFVTETVLAPFVGGSTSQLIPFVFLPMKGQLIYPSKEISLAGLQTPVCAVSKAKFLTTRGWMDLKNPVNGDVPFRLYRDEGRSFLQWDGEADLRLRLSGHIVLVYLKCREAADMTDGTSKITTPSVAFRIVGTPTYNPHTYNVSEVSFISNAQLSTEESNLLSLSEYVAIGICSLLLGLIYVASVFLYLHIRKRNRLKSGNKPSNLNQDPHSLAEEGIVKNNPLLGLSGHFQTPDSEGTMSDNDGRSDVLYRDERASNHQLTSVVVHSQQLNSSFKSQYLQCHLQESSNIERLPEENVSIVETLEGREDKSDDMRGLNGTIRRKLYFNPAYFEPHLLAAPPPAAIEFLQKIREVISIAKQKMSTKKYIPTLLGIPEEDYGMNVHAFEFNPLSRNGSIVSLKRENSRKRRCSGCPGCQSDEFRPTIRELSGLPTCNNCTTLTNDVKQRSIRKWLEDIPVIRNSEEINIFSEKNLTSNSMMSPKSIRAPTEGPPSLPSTRSLVRSVSKREPKKMRGSSPTRSLSPDFGRSMTRPMSPRAPSDKASESDCSGSETYKTSKTRRRQGSRIRKPKIPPPLPPGSSTKIKEATENIYDTVANDNGPLASTSDVTINGEGLQVPTLIQTNMKAVIDEFAINNGIDTSIDNSTMDYEADSLERTEKKKSIIQDYGELSSSQPSPSLSSALPMDEEMTMRNAVINSRTGNRTISKLPTVQTNNASDTENEYELIVLKKSNSHLYKLPELLQRNRGYSLVSEVYVNNGYNYNSSPSSPSDSNSSTMEKREVKVCYALENQPGKLLIEVEDCLDNYIPVNDSDSFEPDTLDRKPSKRIDKPTESFVDSLERPQADSVEDYW